MGWIWPTTSHGDFGGFMKTGLERAFAHRYSAGGNVESICLKCFLAACLCRGVEQMIQEEAKHICEPDPMLAAFHFPMIR
jgi:hypothetical protein